MSALLPILFGAVLINVLVLEDAAGLRLFGEGSDQISDLLMGCLVIAVLLAASAAVTYPIEQWLLPGWELPYIEPLLLTLVIASLIEVAAFAFRGPWTRSSFPRARMTFVLANAAILAVAVSALVKDQGFLMRIVTAALLGVLFALVMAAFAALAYRLRTADTPRTLRGLPIAAITAGILCLAFTALAGLFPMTLAASKFGGLGLTQPVIDAAATIITAAAPEICVLPLQQHRSGGTEPRVDVGDVVRRGQCIAEPESEHAAFLHAPISGKVVAIEPRANPFFLGEPTLAIVIENDGLDTPDESFQPTADFTTHSPESIREAIRRAGICGLGGAMFPTAEKIAAAAAGECRTVLLNGAECEPYITCDDALMRSRAANVVLGAQIIMHACGAPRCVIAIEQDKPQSLLAIQQAVAALSDSRIEVHAVAAFYPAGGECQLIAALFDCEVPAARTPVDIGILCQNVGTAAAIANLFRNGEPLLRRIITVTGGAVAQPANVEARIGTSFAALIAQCGGYRGEPQRMIMGGAMMGVALGHDEMPIIKGSNCIVAATAHELTARPAELPCIRCGDCAEVCPSYLLPQQLYWYARKNDAEALRHFGLNDCIECGCCDYVCPSKIHLASRFGAAKRRFGPLLLPQS